MYSRWKIFLLNQCQFMLKWFKSVADVWTLSRANFTTTIGSLMLRTRSASPHHVIRGPSPPPPLSSPPRKPHRSLQEPLSSHLLHVQAKMERRVDAEVGKAHHMHVTRHRQYVVGAIPGRQYYASPLSLPLTHPQPCWAWSMIMTW